MAHPLAWKRTLELADAQLRISRNSVLGFEEDEDPQQVIPLLIDHGLFQQPLGDHRELHMNGGTEPIQIQVQNSRGEGTWELVLEPGQAKITYRGWLDAVISPSFGCSILSSEETTIRRIEHELNRIGYSFEEAEGG